MTTAMSYADFFLPSFLSILHPRPNWYWFQQTSTSFSYFFSPTLVLNSSLLSFSFTGSFFCSVFDFDCCIALSAAFFVCIPTHCPPTSLPWGMPTAQQPTCPFLFTPYKLSNLHALLVPPRSLFCLQNSTSITRIFPDPMQSGLSSQPPKSLH